MAKFIEEIATDEWEVYTPNGWKSFRGVGKTIEYEEWCLNTETKSITCADTHIFLTADFQEILCKDIEVGDYIQTVDGPERVLSNKKTSIKSNMYDLLDVEGGNLYYTNNIVSHNSTTVIAYLQHYAIFNEKVNIAILANKASTAKVILDRLQTSYENLPKWMQHGIKSWNKTSLELENGSKIVANSTSATAVRGDSYNVIFLDEYAFVPNQIAKNFMSSVYPTITAGKESKIIIVSCVTKDTYLLTNSGYRRIETLINKSKNGAYIVPEYTVRGNNKFYSSNIVVNHEKSPTNIIKTCYESLECSENHCLWVFKNGKYDYVKSKDLAVGDYVAVKYNQQIFGNDDYIGPQSKWEYVTEKVAYSVGVFVSSITKYEIDEDLILTLKLLGFNFTDNIEKNSLPDKVLSWSKKNILSLLRGIFVVSGTISVQEVSYIIYSKELSRQVQLLLSNLGIFASYEQINLSYKITMQGNNIKKFINILNIECKISTFNYEEKNNDVFPGNANSFNVTSNEDLAWVKIKEIEKSENEVFDVSLPDVKGDQWAHSVLYNNFLGHQTPFGMNHFYKLWDDAIKGRSKYIPFRVYWDDHPDRNENFKEETIANTSLTQWNAEYECEFLGSSDTLISGRKLSNLVTESPLISKDLLDVYEDPQPDKTYVITVDVAEGVELDYSAFVVFDVSQIPYKVVAKYRNNDIPSLRFPDIIEPVGKHYNNAYILCEVNNDAQVANILHLELDYPNVLQTKTLGRGGQVAGQNFSGKGVKYGIKMSKPVKKNGCLNLKTFIEEDKLLIYDRDIIDELTTFVSRYNSFSAEEGKNDDLVMCLVLFAWLCNQDYFKEITETDIRKKIREEHEQEMEDNGTTPFGFVASVDVTLDGEVDSDGLVWFPVQEDDFSYFWNYNF